jgi:cobaltochelatase CobT
MSIVRQQQQIEELCAATLRALTGDGELHYRGHLLHRGAHPLRTYAPHSRAVAGQDDLVALRAAADGMALRLLHSDAVLHRLHCPSDSVERLIFELLEQLRVETLVPTAMPGMTANLAECFASWSRQFHESGATESSLGILFYTVAQIAWSRLNARPVLDDTEDLIEVTRAGIAAAMGPPLVGMRKWRHDQARFASYALDLAQIVGAMVRAENEDTESENASAQQQSLRGLALLLDFDQEESAAMAMAASGSSKVFGEAGERYRVFTTAYDVEVAAAMLVRKALLHEYRERLDTCVIRQGMNIPRLARLFGAILAKPQRDDWLFGEEDGRIDGRRLAQLVSSPAESRLFKRERTQAVAEATVSFLIDCSGSMKGVVESVATLVDILVRALDMVGVETEVLGFTTGAWNGGRPYREWLRQGRPRYPGRLNEVCHMVFKEAKRNWRRSRTDMAALLKADLFREGIDGEAVDWACTRLCARDAKRRILIVISDGCPMDSATGLANDNFYLDKHLKDVVARREREGAVTIIGLGAGLDLSPFYRRSASADFSPGLDNQLFFELADLLRR